MRREAGTGSEDGPENTNILQQENIFNQKQKQEKEKLSMQGKETKAQSFSVAVTIYIVINGQKVSKQKANTFK